MLKTIGVFGVFHKVTQRQIKLGVWSLFEKIFYQKLVRASCVKFYFKKLGGNLNPPLSIPKTQRSLEFKNKV